MSPADADRIAEAAAVIASTFGPLSDAQIDVLKRTFAPVKADPLSRQVTDALRARPARHKN